MKMEHLLQQATLFNMLSSAELAPLTAAAYRYHLASGQLLFSQDTACTHFFFVVSGSIRLYRLTSDGKEKIIEIIRAGETFAEAVAIIDSPLPVHASAIETTELIAIPSHILRQQLIQQPKLAVKMLANLSRRIHQFLNDIHQLSLSNAQQRVAGYLLAFLDEQADNPIVRLPATKAMIASRLSLQPETFSRVLSKMKTKGIIIEDNDGHIVICAPDALRYMQD